MEIGNQPKFRAHEQAHFIRYAQFRFRRGVRMVAVKAKAMCFERGKPAADHILIHQRGNIQRFIFFPGASQKQGLVIEVNAAILGF